MKKIIVIALLFFATSLVSAGQDTYGQDQHAIIDEIDNYILDSHFSATMRKSVRVHPKYLFEIKKKDRTSRFFQKAIPYLAGILAGVSDNIYRDARGDYLKANTANDIKHYRARYEKAELARNLLLGVFSSLMYNVKF